MKIGISKKDARLFLYVLGILCFIVVYMLVFVPFQEKNEELAAQNASIDAQIDTLQVLAKQQEEYEQRTLELNQKTQELFSDYPADFKEEDGIMYAVDLESTADMTITNITIGEKNLLYTLGATPSSINETEENAADSYLFGSNYIYTFTSSYDGFKEIIEKIQGESSKKNVDSITISFDNNSGLLIGTISMNAFSVMGSEMIYKEPYIPSMPIGSENIFGTMTPPNAGAESE